LIKNLELQLASTNDRNKRLEDELEALRQNWKDKATTDNERGNKGIQDKYFVNPYRVSLSAQCGETNPKPNKILLYEKNQTPLSGSSLHTNSINQTPPANISYDPVMQKVTPAHQLLPPNGLRKPEPIGLPLVKLKSTTPHPNFKNYSSQAVTLVKILIQTVGPF
jgi:hypothetical protein